MPASGWIAERFGPHRVFLIAIAAFTLASASCGLASGLTELVAARFVQGLAAGVMGPVGRAIVLRSAAKSEVMSAISLIVWPSLLAPVIGPPLGGFITTYASWRWNFFINLPVGLLGFIAVWLWVPRPAVARPGALDLRGALLSAGALVMLLFGLERSAQPGPRMAHWAGPAALVLAGLVCGVFALRHLRRTPHPVVSLAPFEVRTFAIPAVSGGTFFAMCLQATPFLLPLMFQIAFGMTAVQAGLFTLAYFLGNLSMKTITNPVLRRFGFRSVMLVNGLLAALAMLGCAELGADTPSALLVALLFGACALMIAGLLAAGAALRVRRG
jgi:MFS family permease